MMRRRAFVGLVFAGCSGEPASRGSAPGHGRPGVAPVVGGPGLSASAAPESAPPGGPGVFERPMLRAHPRLAAIPRVPLLAGPTPIEEASALARGIGLASLAIKRDDLTHERYGGGKVRKLETLLAQAEASGAERLMTFGSVGSHHALATAVHGIARGFEVELLLLPEPPSESVRSTLARTLATGAEAHLVGSMAAALQRSRHARETTFVVPVGGTSAIANVGFVAAGFEIADAVAQGAIEKPERIYIALGTTGSAAGLALASRQPASRKWR